MHQSKKKRKESRGKGPERKENKEEKREKGTPLKA